MAEKRDHEDYKHLCKLCNKRFPSGKSLGGHMRSHVINNHNADRLQILSGGGDPGGASNSGYGLRENPRKTWRAAAVNLKQERVCVCKRCGKAFQSLKALCGHMSCHSDKERNFNEDEEEEEEDDDEDDADSWGSEEEEEQGKVNGSSSNVSGIEHEQEEVAICLMMLSRDSGQKFGGNLGTESSDNTSVILEGGSRLSTSNHAPVKKKQDLNLDSSDSGYFLNGAKDLESDDSVDGYAGNHGFKKHKPMFGSKFNADFCDSEEKHKRIKNRHLGSDPPATTKMSKPKDHKCPFCPKVFRSGQALGGHKRSHLIGCSAEDKASMMRSVERGPLIDLNLPAPEDEEGTGGDRYQIMHW